MNAYVHCLSKATSQNIAWLVMCHPSVSSTVALDPEQNALLPLELVLSLSSLRSLFFYLWSEQNRPTKHSKGACELGGRSGGRCGRSVEAVAAGGECAGEHGDLVGPVQVSLRRGR